MMYNETLVSIQEDFPHINGVQIYHGNDLVFETYQNGIHHDTANSIGCIFKSFISTAVGIAMRDGLIESVHQKILDFFPTAILKNVSMQDLTIEHALTKTTGIAWPPPGADISVNNMAAVLSLDMKNAPGEVFEYKPDPQLLVYLIEKITEQSLISYVKEKLFAPLGIQNYQWDTGMANIQEMKMPLYEMAKLGHLFLAQGKWQGQQVVMPGFVADSIKPHVEKGFPEQAGYGFLWWVGEIKNISVFFSSGFGGQYLIVVPDRNLVVAIASRMDRPHPENKIIVRNLL